MMITEFVLPQRIIHTEGDISHVETLLVQKELQICLIEPNVSSVRGKGYIIFDFGMEYSGGVRILAHHVSHSTSRIRLRFGESLTECCAEIGEKGACNDHSIRDFTVMLTSYSDMTFGQTGFRFLRIDFLDDAVVTLKNVYCAYTHRVFPKPNDFFSKDKRIEDIFQTAKHTVELCCQNYLWDGIKRDRLVWIGDMHPEMLALTALYGKSQIVEDALEVSIRQYPLTEWMNTMPMYSVWLLIAMADYFKYNPQFVKEHQEYLNKTFEHISLFIDEDGHISLPSLFVDWPTHHQEDELAGCRALLLVMANKCKILFESFGIKIDPVDQLRKRLMMVPITVQCSKQVLALKYWAVGNLSDDEISRLIDGGANGMSTFMSYYILKAVAETSSTDRAISMMCDYYGAMLDKGATTFFEDFDMAWIDNSCRIDEFPKPGQKDIHGDYGKYCYTGFRHSLCHGWSSGVINFLYEYCNQI